MVPTTTIDPKVVTFLVSEGAWDETMDAVTGNDRLRKPRSNGLKRQVRVLRRYILTEIVLFVNAAVFFSHP